MSNGNGRIAKRLLAGGVVGLTGLAFAPISPAGAAISTQAFCAAVPTGQSGFTDIAAAGVHSRNVECLKASAITTGTTATTYSPTANVTRGQMATFIANMIDKANELDSAADARTIPDLPAGNTAPDAFTDDETSVHETNINRIAAADIVQGTTATTFSPDSPVSRAQMATFIAEALEFIRGAALPEGTDAFTDDETSVHEANINRLATADIVDGTSATTYNPNGLVSRAQMASFIIQAMADLHADGFVNAIPAAAGQADFASSVTATTTRTFTGGAPGTGTGGVIPVTFSGLNAARDYDVALVPCSDYSGPSVLSGGQIVLDENGVSRLSGPISFSDQDRDDDADDLGSTMYGNAFIDTIEFTVIGSDYADDISPAADGTLLVRVNSTAGDCVHVVIFDDNADDDALNLAAGGTSFAENDNTPTDDFGVSGALTWTFGEAPSGYDYNGECAIFVNETENFWVDGQGFRINYGGEGDVYNYDGSEVDAPLTLAQFEQVLSLGDCFGSDFGNYSRTNPNSFDLDNDYVTTLPGAPAVAATGDLDGDVDLTDVRFTITPENPFSADIDEYNVRIYNAATGAFVTSEDTDEVNTVGTGDAQTTVTVEDLANGSYFATIEADDETDSGFHDEGPASAIFAVGPAADTARPSITDARVTTDANLQNRFDTDDVVRLTFSEDMADDLGTTGLFELTDADGDVFRLDCGGAAVTCVLSDDGANVDRILTITLVSDPTDLNPAGNGVLNMPANITTTDADVRDQANNVVDLAAAGSDVAVDKEA